MRALGRASSVSLALQRGALACALLFCLLPVAWLFSTAYKPARDVFSHPPTLAFTPTLDNFRTIAGYFDLLQLLRSSLTIAVGSTALALLLGVPAALGAPGGVPRRLPPRPLGLARGAGAGVPVPRGPHGPAGGDADPILRPDAGRRPARHRLGRHPGPRHALGELRRLDDVRLLPQPAAGAGGSRARRRLHAAGRPPAHRPAAGPARAGRERSPLPDAVLERLPLCRLPDPLRHQDALGGAALGLRHQGHHLGHDGRARPPLDPADPAPGAAAQSLLRPGADARGALRGRLRRSRRPGEREAEWPCRRFRRGT